MQYTEGSDCQNYIEQQLGPLHRLLQKNEKWTWKQDQEKLLRTCCYNTGADTSFLPVIFACDSSSYGLGAVLSHRMPDGSERPIASRSLTKTEEKVPPKLSGRHWHCIRASRSFSCIWRGGLFIFVTDHKPLKYIMNPGRAVPVTAAASYRLQRWCLFLGAFHAHAIPD